MNFDFQFDFLDPNRIVLGITYTKGLMARIEKDPDTDEEIGDPELGFANMLTIGFFFFAFTIVTYSFD